MILQNRLVLKNQQNTLEKDMINYFQETYLIGTKLNNIGIMLNRITRIQVLINYVKILELKIFI